LRGVLLCEERRKFIAIVIHQRIPAQLFRIKYAEEVYEHMAMCPGLLQWNGEQIMNWYLRVNG